MGLQTAPSTWWALPRLRPGMGVSSRVGRRHPLAPGTLDIGSRSRSSATAVWLYFRFPLGLRMVEELLAARGIIVSHETVRQWRQSAHWAKDEGYAAWGGTHPLASPSASIPALSSDCAGVAADAREG